MKIFDELLNRTIEVNKVNGYNLYWQKDELGVTFVYTIKEMVVFGKKYNTVESVGRTWFAEMSDEDRNKWIDEIVMVNPAYKEA